MRSFTFAIFFLLCTACGSYAYDEDFDTVPTTNNPHIVPSHGAGLPMMPS